MTSAADSFLNALYGLDFEHTFNPYTQQCPVHDQPDAPVRRAELLARILVAAQQRPLHALWLGRDPGYRGCRRTGLAFTDDVHLVSHVRRWSHAPVKRPTTGPVVAERSARAIWKQLNRLNAAEHTVFLWNVFPLHPHLPDNPFTNRAHSTVERRAGESVLSLLLSCLKPGRVVAIGADASQVATRVAGPSNVIQTRHPSHGGERLFAQQIDDLYRLASAPMASHSLGLFDADDTTLQGAESA